MQVLLGIAAAAAFAALSLDNSVLPQANSVGSEVYTLYANSLLDVSQRNHVATFDSESGSEYNRENCNVAADLLRRQLAVSTRFWCEAGRFKK